MDAGIISLHEAAQLFPNCSTRVLKCLCCINNQNIRVLSSPSSNKRYTWCELLSCASCRSCWYICKSCTFAHQFKNEQLPYHHRCHHSKSLSSPIKSSAEVNFPIFPDSPASSSNSNSLILNVNDMFDDDDFKAATNPDENLLHHFNESCKQLLSPSVPDYLHSQQFPISEESQFQFWHQRKKSMQYLMAQSCFNNISSISNISSSDALLNLQIFDFVRQLNRSLQSEFASILNNIRPHMLPSFNKISENDHIRDSQNLKFNSYVLPSSYSDLRNTYLRGKSSMIENIPSVPVQTMGSGKNLHSYVSIADCVKHFLMFGGFGIVELDDNNEHGTKSIFNSVRCHNYSKLCLSSSNQHESLFLLPIVLFTDDFDPSVSLVKSNKKSIWMYSLTFKSQKVSVTPISNTYILAIGNKGSDHIPVLTHIEKELNMIRDGGLRQIYHGSLQKYVNPVLIPLLRHGDQPERRSINMLKLGKETNHARWRYSLNIRSCKSKLPSCPQCVIEINACLKEGNDLDCSKIFGIICNECSNWSFDAKHMCLHSHPPNNYPIDSIPLTGLLPPLKLNKSLIQEAVAKTHQKIKDGIWSVTNGRSFLEYYCIKTDVINIILEKATNAYNLTVSKNALIDQSSFNFILEDAEKYPDLYTVHSLSHIYEVSQDDLESFPDTPMHLFSGYVKATMSLVMLFLRRKGRYNAFINITSKDKTTEHLSSMKLQWLKVIPYTSDKFASYGCENYIALSSIFKLQSLFLKQLTYDEKIVFPTTPQKKWTANINRKWLSVHGFKTSGNAIELKERVAKHMANGNENLVLKIHQIDQNHIVRMLVSVYNSLKLLLYPTITDDHIDRTHCYIIKALNEINFVDKHVRANHNSPIWFLKYNLLCLLNCKEDLKMFGPTSDRWEGSLEGEKGIQLVKKEFCGFRKGFQYQTHQKINISQSMKNIQNQFVPPDIGQLTKHNNPISGNKSYVKYKNTIVFTSKLVQHHPLSLVSITRKNRNGHNLLGFVTSSNFFYPLQHITFQAEKNYCYLFTIPKLSSVGDCRYFLLERENITEYIVAIPYILNDIVRYERKLFFLLQSLGRN